MNRAVLTTSSSGLDNYDITHSKIKQIRLNISVENIEFVDGKNINRERLIYLINKISKSAVNTSPASIEEVTKIFDELYAQNFDEVFVLTLSSEISKSFDIISTVAERFENKMKVVVFDTKALNGCEAILALEAEHLLNQGFSIEDVYFKLSQLRTSYHMLFAVDDITQLIRNKKLSTTSGFLANLLNIKPILYMSEDGKILPLAKIRHFNKAQSFIVNELENNLNFRVGSDYLYILDTGNELLTQEFSEYVKEALNISYLPILPASSISIANHGTDAIGLCMFRGSIPSVINELNL